MDLASLSLWQTCDCLGCKLVRNGCCLECAAHVGAEVRRGSAGDRASVPVCRGSCVEALEVVLRGWQGHEKFQANLSTMTTMGKEQTSIPSKR
jgi:hypothetical protein